MSAKAMAEAKVRREAEMLTRPISRMAARTQRAKPAVGLPKAAILSDQASSYSFDDERIQFVI